ncbi:MAG: PAS domain S-box protein, partial [Candidatus Methanofastidiosia archaeon]
MEKKLRELKEMYENMVENANDPVMLIDRNGYFSLVNRKFCELSGYSPEEIKELHYSKIVHPNDLEMVQDRHERRFAGEDVPQNYRFRVLKKNGDVLYVDFNANAIKKKGKVVAIHAVARDITKRKKAEEKLRESEEMYRTLVKTSPDAVTVTDLEGNITFVSHRTLEVHGFEKAEELIGKSAFELIAPEDHEEAMINLKKTLKEGFLGNLEYTLLRKDGTSFIGELNTALIKDTNGKPKAFIATTRDVTERKWSEEALREEKRRYRALFERTNDAVFIISLEDIHLEINQQAADMLGYKIDEIVGRSFADFISPDEHKDAEAKKKALLQGKTLPVYERTFCRKDGTEFPAEINIALVYDDNGKPLHFHSVVRDITDRKQAEEALQRNEEKYRTIL